MDNTLEIITDYIKRHVNNAPENLSLESKLEEIGVDSLAMLEFMFELEEKHGIRLPDDITKPETVGQLLEIVKQYSVPPVNE